MMDVKPTLQPPDRKTRPDLPEREKDDLTREHVDEMSPETEEHHAIETPKQWKWKRHVFITLFSLTILVAISAAIAFSWYLYQLQPVSSQEKAVEFVIEQGDGAVNIGDRLEKDKLIRSSTAFQFYLRQNGDSSKLKAGTYLLSPSLSVAEVSDVLIEGKTAKFQITIPPGLTLAEIRQQLIDKGLNGDEIDTAFQTTNPYKEEANLEGYLFPETYTFELNVTPQQVVNEALSTFEKQLSTELTNGFSEQGLSVHGAVILASIVQKESSDPDNQKKIAQVFLRRLDEDIALGADPTFRYAASLTGGVESPSIDHPYNTRIYKGLPPGPIGNFNLTALEAVANPADTNYLFFVSGDDGITRFSNTQEEHDALIDKYCIELCKL